LIIHLFRTLKRIIGLVIYCFYQIGSVMLYIKKPLRFVVVQIGTITFATL